ncbi:hypothetical protein HGM15179_001031 [Zosterops borbonicus]|uniref:Uncharacterized protein n=1 Tax=Zosterops borbonicus TaxID=364589 RepID=A0A8K1LTT9_9PASS|nr:hypothetical protein HGM15179_001031 [Zosterops borbonicus]
MTTWRSVPDSAQGRRIQGWPGRCSVELEHLSSEERLRQLEELSLEKSLLGAAFQYLKEAYTKEAETDSDRTRGNGLKLTEQRFRLDVRKEFFTLRAVRHWHRLPREAVDAPFKEVFKARLDGVLSNLL